MRNQNDQPAAYLHQYEEHTRQRRSVYFRRQDTDTHPELSNANWPVSWKEAVQEKPLENPLTSRMHRQGSHSSVGHLETAANGRSRED